MKKQLNRSGLGGCAKGCNHGKLFGNGNTKETQGRTVFAQGILRQRQSADAPAGACTLRADMESAPTVYTKDCNNDKGSWRGQAPSLQNQRLRGCRGEQCSPVQFSGGARLPGASRTPPPTAHTQISVCRRGPVCRPKRWPTASRAGPLVRFNAPLGH